MDNKQLSPTHTHWNNEKYIKDRFNFETKKTENKKDNHLDKKDKSKHE